MKARGNRYPCIVLGSPFFALLTGCGVLPGAGPQAVTAHNSAFAHVQAGGNVDQLKLELDTAVRTDLQQALGFVGSQLKAFDAHIHRRDVAKVTLFGSGQAASVAATTLGATAAVV